jgi:hypothetical protein
MGFDEIPYIERSWTGMIRILNQLETVSEWHAYQ